MVSFPAVKNFQPSFRGLIRPMLIVSLALHGLILFTPTSFNSPDVKPEEPEDETVNLTQLPPINQPAAKPSPAPRPSRAAVSRTLVSRPAAPLTVRPTVPPAVRSPATPPTTPANTSDEGSSVAANNTFLANFPRYPGAQSGSWGLPPAYDPFSQKTGDALSAVAAFFERELRAKGYTIDLIEDTAVRHVYSVAKEGTTQYLNLLPNQEGAGTSIILSPQPLPADLTSGRVVSPEEASFYEDLSQIIPIVDTNNGDWQNVTEPTFLLNEPTAFFATLGTNDNFFVEPELKPGIQRAILGVRSADQQALYADLENKLQIAYFEVTSSGTYGGGALYQITRDGITGYISLVPTKDGTGTAIFLWNRSPR